ncbi:ABC transporter permease [Nguyenibacter vanlangensis]|uniref:ABC transporter permease n=1 Tax=Nguyenibacter vanlangensis TaxID=1216886 RepID=A0A7Y7IVK6_9PROT|nr:ABC transporter permease [Nguyenibacter vanlangensis]NVN11163.1 ABC transporter permease [Nguyenibacter vanlangensis]
MLVTICQSIVRQARRHPLHVGLNVAGLALGIGVFLTLALLVRYEYRYNAGLPDVDRLVRVDEHWTLPGSAPSETGDISFRALPFLREDFPEIEDAVRLTGTDLRTERAGLFSTYVSYLTDPSFFRVFKVKLLHGSPDDALSKPDGLVLSQGAALRLFGTTDVLARTVTVNRNGTKTVHTVSGVLATPEGPGFLSNVDMLAPIPAQEAQTRACYRYWGSFCGEIYLKLRRPGDLAAMNARLRDFVVRRAAGPGDDQASLGAHPDKIYALSLVPLREARFHDLTVEDVDDGVDRNVVDSIGLIGVLALGLACANAVNLATARSAFRAREVAIRKTLGAARHGLFAQFMGEALLIAAIAGLSGLAFCEVMTPIMASLTGEAIGVQYGFVLAMLPLVVLVTGLASGCHPAAVLSAYHPATILAAARTPSGGRGAARLRSALVLAQFAIAVTIVICTLVIDRQTAFMRDADRGYVRSGLLIGQEIRSRDAGLQRRMFDTLRAVPGVAAITIGQLQPRPNSEWRSTYSYTGPAGKNDVQLLFDRVGPGYLVTYRPRILAGRWFDTAHGQDDAPADGALGNDGVRVNVVINARAAAKFGFASPGDAVGKVLQKGGMQAAVVGVIDDLRFGSPRAPVYPEIIYFGTLSKTPFDNPIPAVRFQGVTESEMARRLNRAWAGILPDIASDFQSADARTDAFYKGDERRGHVFTLGAAAAMLIACLGLYSLAAFAAVRRTHEIGIRKTMGATGRQIVVLLLRDLLRPVMLSCLVACPVAWIAMRSWLSGFDQRIALDPVYFLLAVAGALLVAVLTVLGQTLRVARAEPARALRAD